MKKIFFSTFYILIFLTIISIFYLTFFGYETKRFNETIKSIINKNDENIELTFEKVKVSLDIKKFSIYVKLTKPNLYYYEKYSYKIFSTQGSIFATEGNNGFYLG